MAIGRRERENRLPAPPPGPLFLPPIPNPPPPPPPPTHRGRREMTEPLTVTARPIEEPITGREDLGDLSRPEQALAQFYRGLNGRDLALLAENWAQSDGAVMDNPLGGIARGWEAIRAIYERLFAGSGRLSIAFHDSTIHRSDST